MQAFVRTDSSSNHVEIADVAVPEISNNEVLVQVEAFGVGIHDRFFIPKNTDFPYPIGTEGAGKIVQTGKQVTDFAVGDRVIFMTTLQPKGGAWAAYAVTDQTALIPMPDALSFQQGAAIPVAGNTALESMRSLSLNEGDSLFIAGASGAIGTFVIQLAAAKGIHVAGSASAQNHDYMESLGAEKTVDYHDPDWQTHINEWSNGGVTAALAIQPETGKDSMDIVKDSGRVITVSGGQFEAERDITVEQIGHHDDSQKEVIQLVQNIADDKIKLVIENAYPFEQGLDALQKTETRHARGKLVVTRPSE
ncbi:NADP-dependent oxidoreductase [Barrientosiimonas marina]|uniref:NADP-dependent oxidoreductase n=1 Tax=Lentibacillus kimchii TaxID=1542911 RepID=A0ABW2URJ6_9BACI